MAGRKNVLPDAEPMAVEETLTPRRSYRAITRNGDGLIVHVRDIQAGSDAEAIGIVTERDVDGRTDLYDENGLVQRFDTQAT